MVRAKIRGRRVRAVVACARNDDCYSPSPKRRTQEIGLEGTVLQSTKTTSITAFFQGVNVDLYKSPEIDDELDFKTLKEKQKTENGEDILITLLAKNEVVDVKRDVPKTPVVVKTMTCNEGPPTPHRIELCPEEAVKEIKTEMEAPKTKKRLNGQDNHKVTDYFPVRRSVRKTKKTVLEEKQRTLEQILRTGIEEGLEVKTFADKGRGVVTSRRFTKGDFVVEYSGDLIDINEAKRREVKYAQDLNAGCYMYYFKHNNQQYCVDATAETGKLGRLVNHSRNGNLITRTVSVDNKPRLVLIAKYDIKSGDEVTYDYGDRSKESLKYHPWLAY